MCNGTQIFHGMTFLLQRKFRRGGAFNLHIGCLELKRLLGVGSQNQCALDDKRRSDILMCDFFIIMKFVLFQNDLKIAKTAAVIQFNKTKGIGCANGFYPTAQCDFLVGKGVGIGIDRTNFSTFHGLFPFVLIGNFLIFSFKTDYIPYIIVHFRKQFNCFLGFFKFFAHFYMGRRQYDGYCSFWGYCFHSNFCPRAGRTSVILHAVVFEK